MASKLLNLFRDPATKRNAYVVTTVGAVAVAGAAYWWWTTRNDNSDKVLNPVTPETAAGAGVTAAQGPVRGRFATKLESIQSRLENYKKTQADKYAKFAADIKEFVGGKTISVEGVVKLHTITAHMFEQIFGKLVKLGRDERRAYIVTDKAIYEEVVIQNYLEIQELFKQNLVSVLQDNSLTLEQFEQSVGVATKAGIDLPAFDGKGLYLALLRKVPATADLPEEESEDLVVKLLNNLTLKTKTCLFKPADKSHATLVKEKLAIDDLFETFEIEEEDLYKLLRKYTTPRVVEANVEYETTLKSV